MEFWQTPLGSPFFSSLSYGLDGIAGTPDDLGPFYFDRFVTFDLGEDGNIGRNHCNQWGVRNRPGRADGRSAGDPLPLNPACKFETIGALRDKPNPFSAEEFNPQIGSFGSRRAAVPPGAGRRATPPRPRSTCRRACPTPTSASSS